jgi:hypothetical protein
VVRNLRASAVALSANILISNVGASSKKAVVLIGGGGGSKIRQMEKYGTNKGDLKLEGSIYGLEPKSIMYLDYGGYLGLEVNKYTVRPYVGFSELLLGINAKKVPVLYLGASSGAILDISGKKNYYSDVGVEASLWAGTILGTLKITERVMIQEYYQTRIDYLFKIPFFGDQASRKN